MPPVIKFTAQCYHYEQQYDDAIGTTSESRVNTYREEMNLQYCSARDISGLFLLNIDKALHKKKAFIKLHLKEEINFADEISFMDYETQKSMFYQRMRARDQEIEFDEDKYIPGFTEFNLIQISEHEPCCVNLALYIILIFIPFCQIYVAYVNSLCVDQSYKLRKIISTRFNLFAKHYDQQYQAMSPALSLGDQTYSFDAADTGYYNQSVKVYEPSEKELQNAQRYSSKIPKYQVTDVRKEINGVQVGVVQDIPTDSNAAPAEHVEVIPSAHNQV